MNIRGLALIALGVVTGLVLNRLLPDSPAVLPVAGAVATGLLILMLIQARRRRNSRP